MKQRLESIEELWNAVLNNVQTKISKPSFDTWLKSTKAVALEGNTLTIAVPSEFAKDWLENQYTGLISDVIEEITGSKLQIKFILETDEMEYLIPQLIIQNS